MAVICLECGEDVEGGFHGFDHYKQGFYDYDFKNPLNYRCYNSPRYKDERARRSTGKLENNVGKTRR